MRPADLVRAVRVATSKEAFVEQTPENRSAPHLSRARIDPPRHLRGTLLGKIKAGMQEAMGDQLMRVKIHMEGKASAAP